MTPHLLVLYSAATVRLATIVAIHALIVPVLTWIVLSRLERRARDLEDANLELRENARMLAQRNDQIDALNVACRLLAGSSSVEACLPTLAELARRIARAEELTINWNDDPSSPIMQTARAETPPSRDADDPGRNTHETIQLINLDRRIGSLDIRAPANDPFTRNTLSVLTSEVGLTWRLRHVEDRALSALSETHFHGAAFDGTEHTRHLLQVLAEAVGARGAALYLWNETGWACRGACGVQGPAPDDAGTSGRSLWHSPGETACSCGEAGPRSSPCAGSSVTTACCGISTCRSCV